MKKLLVTTLLSISLLSCQQTSLEQPTPPADMPVTGDTTLLDSDKPVVELADSLPHLQQP
ncbi:hypothetical protein [Hymenobacter fodinae]|uniref:Uncharacterized protein n=1 Tax=Hymenobacter fodinae TaxID=2510796 RepID=A0A4Z0P041_9BACT|nr:hypothetical protein [Hymenobacter fodinae]TGE03766.1 hypothetical protein EU556_24455 [Hymenobacter fodinae]